MGPLQGRPQAMARLQLGYGVVAKINPRLIYAGVFGFGQDGPYAAKPAYDDLIQGATAMPALMAQMSDGVPRYVPNALVDRIAGLTAVGASAPASCTATRPAAASASISRCSRPWRAPRLGEHSEEVLSEAGFSTDEIAAMLREGVTKAPNL